MSSPSTTHDQRRLFLALWPEDAERRQMAEMAASIAGRRRVRDAHLHLTLVFLGATDSARLAAYEAALADVSVPILDLILDRCGYWPRPRILWLGCSRSSLELDNLVANLRQRLCGCGFTPNGNRFKPTLPWPATIPVPPRCNRRWRRCIGGSAR
ncbi:MAG: RNA 2',3'-cyclic phosphodiesterase [Candidatus Competibacteraceae bacterium]|nr:RNA 2',3'-cyclic phosphodiesterase [Candidatus Competibacteraceae bacterium]